MPYIGQEVRKKLDGPIDSLIESVIAEAVDSGDELNVAGMLNYAATRLFLSVFRILFRHRKYWHFALVAGVLDNMKSEIYRKLAANFEDAKCKKNGEIGEFEIENI